MKLTTPVLGILLIAAGNSSQALAVTQSRSDYQQAVNNCQGALPNYEGAFRKRPLGIANEGASAAFVSCADSSEVLSSDGITQYLVLFTNRTGAAVNVSCTLIDGIAAPFGSPIYLPKVFPIAANAAVIGSWTPADNGGLAYGNPALSCSIPPGTEINGTQSVYDTDVGA